MGRRFLLGDFEHQTLLVVFRLGDRAYGKLVRQELAKRTGRDVARGAVQATLERLEEKEFVRSRMRVSPAAPDSQPRRYYEPTGAGKAALVEMKTMYQRLWARLRLASGNT